MQLASLLEKITISICILLISETITGQTVLDGGFNIFKNASENASEICDGDEALINSTILAQCGLCGKTS